MPGTAFETAAKESRQLKSKPGTDELLEMYALFKVANGEDISKAPAPGMFDLKGKAKQKAWQKEVDASTSTSDAEKRYVDLVNSLKDKYGFDPNKSPEPVGGS